MFCGRKLKTSLYAVAVFSLMTILGGCGGFTTAVKDDASKKSVVVMVQQNKLAPSKVTIQRGTTVIWLNGTSGTFINVYFTEGKQVEEVCTNPTRFFMGEDGKFVSGMIPPGAVASICFLKPGIYNYMVGGLTRNEYGTVVVE